MGTYSSSLIIPIEPTNTKAKIMRKSKDQAIVVRMNERSISFHSDS